MTRLIDAPVARVWAVATGRIAEWWCPQPWRTDIVEADWRAGGRFALVMRGPGGEEQPIDGVFPEVAPARRFVFTDAFRAGWLPQGPFIVGTFGFEDEGGRTRYTATARHWSEEARAGHETMGFAEGWGAAAAQLAVLAEA